MTTPPARYCVTVTYDHDAREGRCRVAAPDGSSVDAFRAGFAQIAKESRAGTSEQDIARWHVDSWGERIGRQSADKHANRFLNEDEIEFKYADWDTATASETPRERQSAPPDPRSTAELIPS